MFEEAWFGRSSKIACSRFSTRPPIVSSAGKKVSTSSSRITYSVELGAAGPLVDLRAVGHQEHLAGVVLQLRAPVRVREVLQGELVAPELLAHLGQLPLGRGDEVDPYQRPFLGAHLGEGVDLDVGHFPTLAEHVGPDHRRSWSSVRDASLEGLVGPAGPRACPQGCSMHLPSRAPPAARRPAGSRTGRRRRAPWSGSPRSWWARPPAGRASGPGSRPPRRAPR